MKTKVKDKLAKIILVLASIEIMCIQVYAADLELEPKKYHNKAFQFEISDTWTSKGETIKSYDVSESGQVAITFSNQTIGVFDKNMNFIYQLSFKTDGAHGALWRNENLLFIDLRSDTAVVLNNNGTPENYYTITAPKTYFNEVDKRLKERGNYQYFCANGSGGNNPLIGYGFYTILKRISKEGKEEILYEVDTLFDGVLKARLTIIYFMGIFGLVVLGKWYIKHKLETG